jgi:hypothetical protein
MKTEDEGQIPYLQTAHVLFSLFFLAMALTACNRTEPVVHREYTLSIKPDVFPNGNVLLDVETNIPGTIEVSAGLSLPGQGENDIWVGKNKYIRIVGGKGSVTLSTGDLPKGEYNAEVSFFPQWGFKDAMSRATGITDKLTASSRISLKGSGASTSEVLFKKNGQKWVMEHVNMGDPWRPAEWVKRFGHYQEIPVDYGNHRILKAYYFPRIDITLTVNILKGEISIWSLGKAHS